MKNSGDRYSSIRHENSAVIEGLRKLYDSYKGDYRYRFFDYLSEFALSFPEEKDIVEILRVKIENNSGSSWGFYSVFEHIIDKSKENPKNFMLNILGEEEWEELSYKLSRRSISEAIYFKEFIENEIEREKYIGDKGRHHEGYVCKKVEKSNE